ncbi:hypothetical protein O7626_17410 [Micromonospora sp. WMMD1102]|uniref:hypothetical protein n=1 Tax=Micromonospora sp. WMMD1102 TaxID=3016105 RepID=UPI0024151584|nr:hypothetical protein [Micromonospora sp. WMMD1102]MDG4787695.1 hypothetical protein [Micromonospora sp. WMMD1102]
MRLHLTAAQHTELHPYLFDVPERIAFLFLRLSPGGTAPGGDAHVGEVRLLEPGDYLHRDQHYVELAEHVRPAVIRTAHQHRYAVVEAHAHDWPGPSTRFSPTDLDGLQQLGPHMTWRLPGRPYTALVFGRESFDALQWHPDGSVTSIDALVIGGEPKAPTGISLGRLAAVPSWRTR